MLVVIVIIGEYLYSKFEKFNYFNDYTEWLDNDVMSSISIVLPLT